MTALAIAAVLVIPVLALVGLLRLVDARAERRARVVARQIALTNVIHAALGPVVAPVVRRGRRGKCVAVLPVTPGHPQLARMIELTQAELGPAAEIRVVESDAWPRRAAAPAPLVRPGAGGALITRAAR
jgi:hypothetical protein